MRGSFFFNDFLILFLKNIILNFRLHQTDRKLIETMFLNSQLKVLRKL